MFVPFSTVTTVALYCLSRAAGTSATVKSLRAVHSDSQKNPGQTCLTFAGTVVAAGSSYISYQLPLRHKQRASNCNQINKLSSGAARTAKRRKCKADVCVYTVIYKAK